MSVIDDKDEDLNVACKLLGIELFKPPTPLSRVPKLIDGKACLVFEKENVHQEALNVCKVEVGRRCEEGYRSGCTLQAMDKCRGNPLMRALGLWKRDEQVVQQCEEQHMEACMAKASKTCQQHAQDFCHKALPKMLCEK